MVAIDSWLACSSCDARVRICLCIVDNLCGMTNALCGAEKKGGGVVMSARSSDRLLMCV